MNVNCDEWRNVPRYDGAYQANRDGQIRSWRWRRNHFAKTPKLMTPFIKKSLGSRRRFVKLTDRNGQACEVSVLQIMVNTWKGGCPEGLVPYHKNGDLADSSVNNIGFATRCELGRMTGAKSRRMPVVKVDSYKNQIAHYSSAREAGRQNNMSYQTVLDRCHGRVKNPYSLDGYNYAFDR